MVCPLLKCVSDCVAIMRHGVSYLVTYLLAYLGLHYFYCIWSVQICVFFFFGLLFTFFDSQVRREP